MVNFRNIAGMGRAFGQAITKWSSERAVAAQARVNGGAMNASAQSSVQSATDKALKHRRDALLGQTDQLLVSAPEAPHLESHNDDARHAPKPPRYRHRRISGGPGGQSGHKGR